MEKTRVPTVTMKIYARIALCVCVCVYVRVYMNRDVEQDS